MKKTFFYFLSLGVLLLNFSVKPRESMSKQKNLEKSNYFAKQDVKSIKSVNPLGSGQTTIYNYSSNTISSIVVQCSIGGNTTYNNPSLPLTVYTNGNVTIVVHFHSPGVSGTQKLYQLNFSGGWDYIPPDEPYQPPYLSPVYFTSGAGPNYTVYYEFRIS